MTVLSGQSIRARGIFTPFSERTTHASGMTYGLGPAGYDVRLAQPVSFPPNGFVLASTEEHFDVPTDLLATVHDKSTLAREGLAVQTTVIEPGWRGHLTLELTNHSARAIQLAAGTPIAQIVLHRLDEPAERPYAGRYQDQPAGPVAARYER